MVYLSRIYTKTGDLGETSLGDGTRVAKNHARVTAYGSVDELNALLGVLQLQQPPPPGAEVLPRIQNDLFDVGADLCVPATTDEKPGARLRVVSQQSVWLEQTIDQLNETLQPLTSFVLPGGSASAAWCHLARTVCRRAERDVVTLSQQEPINREIIIYLNRLSDLLFVMARAANNQGRQDVLWKPGEGRKG